MDDADVAAAGGYEVVAVVARGELDTVCAANDGDAAVVAGVYDVVAGANDVVAGA